MGTLIVRTIIRGGVLLIPQGLELTGDEFRNDGDMLTFAQYTNATLDPITITFVTQKTVDGQGVDDRAETLAGGETRLYGPFQAEIYNDDNGNIQVQTTDNDPSIFATIFRLGV